MAVSVMAAARKLARKRRTIATTSSPPSRSACDDVVDRDLDEVGLPEDPPVDRHAARQLALKRVELSIEPRRELDRVGAGLFLDADDHRRLAVARSLAALERRAFTHVGDVADEHRPIAAQRDDAVADLLRRAGPADRLQHVLLRAFHVDAGGRVLARAADARRAAR